MKIDNNYSNFKLIKKEYSEDIRSEVLDFEHKCGLRLIALKNEDNNKTFGISFKTPPEDSTGVFHILEHCVLSGSGKYPVKDIFSELMKGGLATFLNAMTGPERTYYPFSTRNRNEFFNLMDVYLDTTLNPLLTKESFYKEGWHYELNNADDKLKIQGIVYNEMKGVISDPFKLMYNKLISDIYPNSTYSHISGGNPENIPDLTYEMFIDYHKKYYHPSNAIICLYGNEDIKECLKRIDNNFLSGIEKKESEIKLKLNKISEDNDIKTLNYSVNPQNNLDNKTFLSMAVPCTKGNNKTENLALSIFSSIIFNSKASPLKKAFIDSKLVKEINGYYNDRLPVTLMFTIFTGINKNNRKKILDLYKSELQKLSKNKIDKELLQSEINSIEFKLMESYNDVRRGLNYFMAICEAEDKNIDIYDNFKIEKLFKEVSRLLLETDYIEDLINKFLLEPEHRSAILLEPDPEKFKNDRKDKNLKLEKIKKTLSNDELKEIIALTDKLKSSENISEDISCIPHLSLNDIETDSKYTEPLVESFDEIPLIHTNHFTSDIAYINIGFKVDKLNYKQLKHLDLMFSLLSDIGTAK